MCRGQQQTHRFLTDWLLGWPARSLSLTHPRSALKPWSHPATKATPPPHPHPELRLHPMSGWICVRIRLQHPSSPSMWSVHAQFTLSRCRRGKSETSCVHRGPLRNQHVWIRCSTCSCLSPHMLTACLRFFSSEVVLKELRRAPEPCSDSSLKRHFIKWEYFRCFVAHFIHDSQRFQQDVWYVWNLGEVNLKQISGGLD